MVELKLTDIAYNTPCLIAVNVGKGAEARKRKIAQGVGIVYYFEAIYNGQVVKLEVSESRKKAIEKLGCDADGMVYLCFHAKGGLYYGDVSKADYFIKVMRCTKLSAKEYLYKMVEYSGDMDKECPMAGYMVYGPFCRVF